MSCCHLCLEWVLGAWVGSLVSKPHKGYRSGYRSGYAQGIVLGPHRIHIFALCCDATLVSPLTRTGQPQPGTVADDGAMLRVAERRKRAAYPELSSGGPQRLLVLGSEIGGRWRNETAQHLVRDLARVRAQRASPALRAAATSAWTRRWWATLAVAVQQAVSSTALGSPWPAPPHASQPPGPELDRVLDLAEAAGPSRLPLRP